MSFANILFASAEHTRIQAQIDAQRITQKARNEAAGAQAALANFSRALSNKRALDAAGAEISAINENIGRNLDAASYGQLGQRVAAAEELGASVATAAAAGVGGSTIDLYNQQIMASYSREEDQADRALQSDLYLATEAKGNTLQNAVNGLDSSQTFANLDFRQFVDHKKMSAPSQVAALAGSALATYYGGPKAGQAVADAFVGYNDAQNGNFGAAATRFDSAISGGLRGAKEYSSLGGKGEGGEAWGKEMWSSAERYLGNIRLS